MKKDDITKELSIKNNENTIVESTDKFKDLSKWYKSEINKLTEKQEYTTRLETKVNNSIIEKINTEIEEKEDLSIVDNKTNNIAINNEKQNSTFHNSDIYKENFTTINQKNTKVDKKYSNANTHIQNYKMNENDEYINNNEEQENRIQDSTNQEDSNVEVVNVIDEYIGNDEINSSNIKQYNKNRRYKNYSKVATLMSGTKVISNTVKKFVGTGKSISTGTNEDGLKTFENTSSRIMTKPIRNVTNEVKSKATNTIVKNSKSLIKKTSKKVTKKIYPIGKNVTKVISTLIKNTTKSIISMLPSIAPILIILPIIVSFLSFFGIGMTEETRNNYENYMINTQNEYDKVTLGYYNSGIVVEGAIEGKGMINWRAPLSIIQMLNGDLVFDSTEIELLNEFKNAGLFETITEESYTVEKEVTETDENGNTSTKIETITEIKEIVSNPSLEDYINWCSSNFSILNKYKKSKNVSYDETQTSFTNEEREKIKLLYDSTMFFDLFSVNFKNNYAYSYVEIGDEQLQAIYDEFLKNAGTRYYMDHSNLKYDECMDYYDCSSWVIHCLAHTEIKTIPNTGAVGIYQNYCNPVAVSDRKAGDLIFMKDTYDTGVPGSISHVGIYMGELTINGVTAEWIIDTGGNPSGVKISKYTNGWWNGSNFYGFGRLK